MKIKLAVFSLLILLSVRVLYLENVIDKLQLQLELSTIEISSLTDTINKQNEKINSLKYTDNSKVIKEYEDKLQKIRHDKINKNVEITLDLLDRELKIFSNE